MAEPVLDDVFIDDITVPAMDGHPLGATLFLPRGTKRHAVLINSATAVPRKIYRGFATLPRRARLRGADLRLSRHRRLAAAGDERRTSGPTSLAGFEASMSDWAAQRHHRCRVRGCASAARRCRSRYVGHSFGGQALGPATEQHRDLARAFHCSAGRLLEADDGAGAVSRLRHPELRRRSRWPVRLAICRARAGLGMDLPKDAFLQWVALGDEPALPVR